MKKIIVVGSANMDLVMRAPRLPRPGETLMGTDFMTAHGGKGANQAVAAARLGAEVRFAAAIGDDAFGALQREGLRRENILLDALKCHHDLPTGTAMILISDSGENTIVVAPGANNGLLPADIQGLRKAFTEADAVVCQLEIPLETVQSTLHLARECSVFSILDAGPARPLSADTLQLADLVTPNESEAEALTGICVDTPESARKAAQALRDMGVAHVLMKLGARGCLYLGDGEVYLPAFTVSAVDTTGAGDAFTAALALAWGRTDLESVLHFANAAGALAATVIGAQPSMPRLDAVIRFLQDEGFAPDWI